MKRRPPTYRTQIGWTWLFRWLDPAHGWGQVTFSNMPRSRAGRLWRKVHPDIRQFEVYQLVDVVRRRKVAGNLPLIVGRVRCGMSAARPDPEAK